MNPFNRTVPATSTPSGSLLKILASAWILALPVSAGILRVAEGATGAGNGTSWADAYPKLQNALTAAVAGDEIWVAAGVYFPDERIGQADGTASSFFGLRVSIPLYGGFAGTEILRTERNPTVNVTVLSGDIAQDDVNTDGNRIAESSSQIVGTNSTTVVRFPSGSGIARLDGFTITAGSGTSTGGGLYSSRPGLTVEKCRFFGNRATSGGGTYVSFYRVVFTRCEFAGNAATTGAAAYVGGQSTAFSNCVFSSNSAAQHGGAVYAGEQTQAVNCLFESNTAVSYGGAWYDASFSGTPVIAQCTLAGNSATLGGGLYSASGQIALRNSIIWGNTATGTSVAVAASIAGQSLPTISRCDIAGSGGSSAWNNQAGINFGGNLDLNPFFLGNGSPTDRTLAFRLLTGSPVIDAGLASNLPADSSDLDGDGNLTEAVPIDLAGDSRLLGAAPDMGVFETGGGPAVIATVPVLKLLPDSGTHSPALDLSDVFDATAQSFGLLGTTPSGIATATVDPLSGVLSVTPLAGATGVATLLVAATNAAGRSNYVNVRIEVFPPVFFVDADATGSASGLSWADAFTTVQDALARGGSSHEIRVAEGVYFPDQGAGQTPGSPAAKFMVPAGVTLLGGFAGTEVTAAEADPVAHPTLLSGDVARDDANADGNQVAENPADRVGTNASGFLLFSGAPGTSGIDGFIITAAGSGGALKISGGAPFVRRCHFSGNSGTNGGAAVTENAAAPKFSACCFSGNVASSSGGAVRASGGSITFEDCDFTGNTANSTGGGGAVSLATSAATLRRCVFSQNRCPAPIANGGAIRATNSPLQAVNCRFQGNEASSGGALHAQGAATISLTHCLLLENVARSDGGAVYVDGTDAVFTGCEFAANRALASGGALYHYDCSPVITQCTMAGNVAGQAGGAIYNRTYNTSDPAAPILRNCIIWGNQKGPYTDASGASVEDSDTTHATTYSHCIVAHSGGSTAWNAQLGINLGSNLEADPLFLLPPVAGTVPPQVFDLRVQAGSPAIDSGNNSFLPVDLADVDADGNTVESLPIDPAGRPRIAGAKVDMGIYESEPGPARLATAPLLRYDTFSGNHVGALNVSTLFGASAVNFAVETQSSGSVISVVVGSTSGILDINILPEAFGRTFLVVRAKNAAGYSSYQTLTVDVYPPAVFVNSAASGNANGLSWQNAFPTLQAALQFPRLAGYPLQIWVAQGVYRPDEGPSQIADAPASTFRLGDGCRIYGGFAGNETQLESRDPLAHPTILSGDLAQDDLNLDGNSIAESIDAISGINAVRIITADECRAGDVIDGFTLTAADGGSSGGGLSCTGGTLAVVACRFQGNRGIWGGGVSFQNASVTLTNCRFTANRADARGLSFSSSGGAACFLNSVVTLSGCRFVANQAADSDGGIGEGGAVTAGGGASITMTGCDFEGTVAGGAVNVENTSLVISDCRITGTLSGGGLSCSNTATTLTRCVISGNSGGGLDFGGNVPLTCTNTVISGNSKTYDGGGAAIWGHLPVRFTNCLIAGNNCGNFGGGIDSWASDSVFMNCTFSANHSAIRGGAFYSESGSSQRFINCILWENQTAGSTTTSFATLIGSPYETPPAHFQNCIVANSGGSTAWNPLSGFNDGGNLDADPRFLVPLLPAAAPSANGDFQLAHGSPALDSGDNSQVSVSTDLAGSPRIINGVVDRGAYEGQNDQFDLDGDGMSDAFELSVTVPPSRTALNPGADDDNDGRLNLLEFAFGLDPKVADSAGSPLPSMTDDAGGRYLSIRYRRNRWAAQFLEMEVERSLNPASGNSWNSGETIVSSMRPLGMSVDEVTERSLSPVTALPAEFLRLRVRKPAQ